MCAAHHLYHAQSAPRHLLIINKTELQPKGRKVSHLLLHLTCVMHKNQRVPYEPSLP
jgi:hypothetical protein